MKVNRLGFHGKKSDQENLFSFSSYMKKSEIFRPFYKGKGVIHRISKEEKKNRKHFSQLLTIVKKK